MKKVVLLLLLLPFICRAQVSIIPEPNKVEFKPGFFTFKNGLSIKMNEADETSTSIEKQFAERLFGSKEWKVPAFTENAKNVVLQLTPGNHNATDENYRIRVFREDGKPLALSPFTEAETRILSEIDRREGWRLACQAFPETKDEGLIVEVLSGRSLSA